MCGSCGDDDPDIPLIEGHHNCCRLGLHINDVVRVTERRGERGRVGFFEDIDLRWGVAFVWTDGSRTWYPRSRWCRDDESGWEVKLVTPDLFQVEVGVDGVGVVAPRLALEEAGFSVAPPEPGDLTMDRSFLKHMSMGLPNCCYPRKVKTCRLPLTRRHKAWWALKRLP